jgi:UDP-sulfoquinovose synthase
MGEYGTPNIDIPEGFFEIEFRGKKEKLPFPRQAGSWYHWSKVHDSNNVMFGCKLWGLRSTDVMQGVVYGTRTEPMKDDRLLTRFDFDEAFGTAINRFCAQAVIGHTLTPYGNGGQKRGFIALRDSMKCLTIALENPPEEGEYRVFNQFDEVYNIYELAEEVKNAAKKEGIDAEIQNVVNPRMELEEHYYNPDNNNLRELGFKPTKMLPDELSIILKDLKRFRERIEAKKDIILPKIKWRGGAGERKD